MSLTLIIIVITGIVSYMCFENYDLKSKLLFHPVSISQRNEWYRFLSHGFIHADMSHLLINMFVLYQFGEFIESYFTQEYMFGQATGRLVFLGLYLGAIVFSSIYSYFKHQNNPQYGALGASGATSAMVFAYIMFNPWGWFIFPPVPGIVLAVGYLFYSSYMGKRGGDNIGHDAHFYGAVFGVIFMLIATYIQEPQMLDMFLERFLAGPTAPGIFNQ